MKYKTSTLGEIADVQTGPFGSQLHNEDYVESGTPIVTVEHLGKRRFTTQNLPFVNDEDKERLSKYSMKKGDIIFSRVGSIDRCSFVTSETDGWLFSGRCLRVRASSEIDPKWLYYFFCMESTKRFIKSIAVGATMPSINTKLLSEVPIKYPEDIRVQEESANVLSLIDDIIEANEDATNNIMQQAMAIYRKKFVEHENSQRKVCKAEDYFDISIGKTPPRKEFQWFSSNKEDMTWVSISDMGDCGLFIDDSSEYLTREAIEKHNIKIVPDNTVLLSFKLTVGRIAITNGEMTTNEAIAHFRTDNDLIVEYLYCYLKNFNYQTLGSTSSIAQAVNSKMIKAMPIIIPEGKELDEFHNIASSMFAEIKSLQEESKKLKELRDTLLPKLISGELISSELNIQ